jgi:NAD(P)-dependent dehydrogenase (short-subunit alcohol dehydrogenase family)
MKFLDKNKNMKKRIDLIPLKRMAEIKEVVNYIVFLASKDNSLISNQVINISGGE